jgi:FkbM family methyltransferase
MNKPIKTARSDHLTSRGMRFPKDGRFVAGKTRAALRNESYEAKEAAAVLKVVREGDVVVELGAGIGFMSTLVATKRKIQAVHAFEANPQLIPYIASVHAANGVKNAHVTNAILGTEAGRVPFYVREKFIASSMKKDVEGTIVATEEVEVLDGKSVFQSIRPTVLICDIEGAEMDLIPALDLSSLRAAVIELHPQWIGPEGINRVFGAFMEAGLAYYARASTNKVVAFRRDW